MKGVVDMRIACLVALPLVVLLWAVTGCARTKPEGVEVQAEAPQPNAAKPSADAAVAGDTGGETGYEGAWGMVMSSIVLEPDGTGRMESAYVGGEEAARTASYSRPACARRVKASTSSRCGATPCLFCMSSSRKGGANSRSPTTTACLSASSTT